MKYLIAYKYDVSLESLAAGRKDLRMHPHVSSDIINVDVSITEDWVKEFQKNKSIQLKENIPAMPNTEVKDVFVNVIGFSPFAKMYS